METGYCTTILGIFPREVRLNPREVRLKRTLGNSEKLKFPFQVEGTFGDDI